MSVTDLFDSISRDLHYALRALTRRPAYTITAVLTLAFGIGATTAIFSVVYSVLIKPLSYPSSHELVRIRHSAPGIDSADLGSSPAMYLTYRDENRTFASIGLWQETSATVAGLGEPERVRSLRVTDGTLQALGVQPMRGRWFRADEYGPAAEGPEPVILSHAFWQRRFGRDQAALGDALSIDSRPAQVVGIMPRDFRFLDMTPQPDVIVAVRLDPARQTIGTFGFQALARLKPGMTPAAARADIERMLPIWLDAWPLLSGVRMTRETVAGWQIAPVVRPLKDDLVGGVSGTLWVLMGAIGAVLLVACTNVANLMLVRADARRQELAVRAAIGAVPARIARELLVESLIIGVAGGALGLMLAYVGIELLRAVGPSNLPRLPEIAVYPPVLAFAVTVSLASTLLFGSIPVLKHSLRLDMSALCASRGASASRERNRTRSAFVVVQVALALVLVVSAALMIRTFQALREVDPGFSAPATIQTARIWIPQDVSSDPREYTRLEREIADGIEAIPGVASVSFSSHVPMSGREGTGGGPVEIEGGVQAGRSTVQRNWKYVAPGYFAAMGTRIVAGRDMTWADIETGGRVALISEGFARELAGEPAAALGKRVRFAAEGDAWREVIGVVQSVHETALYEQPSNFVYWPVLTQNMFNSPIIGTQSVAFVIRSDRAGTSDLMEDVRQAVRSVSGSIPIGQERAMQDLYSGSLARTSFTLVLLVISGAMALALGIIGIYGVIAYVVSQRTREIGVRSALGAHPWQIKNMFLWHGLRLSIGGAVVGLVVAAGLARLMSSLLFGIGPTDPTAYVAALVITLGAAALASYLPARRAANIDPIETLRAE
jgi:putative ABC transport system permease protein